MGMENELLKPNEVDVLFRYPTGRTLRLIRSGKIPAVTLPDGELRVRESVIKRLLEDWNND